MKKLLKVALILSLTSVVVILTESVTDVDKRRKGQIVLKLPYRKTPGRYQKLAEPKAISFFESEGFLYFPSFVSTDWEGRIYIMDTYDVGLGELKCFDSEGRFVESWGPIETYISFNLWLHVCVTKDNYVWVTPHSYIDSEREGLPLLIYKHGQKKPIFDFREKLLESVNEAIERALMREVEGYTKSKSQKGRAWMGCGFECGGEEVVACFFSEKIPGMDEGCVLKLYFRSDGSKVLGASIEKLSSLEETEIQEFSFLAPDGRLWFIKYQIEKGYWKRIWIWQKSERRGKPLFDRVKTPEPWNGKVKLGNAKLSNIYIDSKGQIYLLWARRKGSGNGYLTFLIEGQKLSIAKGKAEQALIVLNQDGRVLSWIPWTSCRLEGTDTWIQPLPDGSGFYRMEFSEREARVYFHPLPK